MKKNRLTAKTPKFFRVLRNIGLALASVATAIFAHETTMPGVEIPEVVEQIATHAATAGAIISAVSQCAVENPKDLK